ncbi:tRNA adenosine deaminase-associated protein [Nocardioides sp. TRM66260-LWL]|uniref:tRNA adenosine deaminase-associated protein n=1 Tax=Nocardioides sp. TRM66260-LWL TaxID=2874478 RepID=UPI001CC4E801|nr:tRNA adenosine deaminase-associated protein [Nocardioides sp. TRM66260-LWL]MBZ5736370.1 tRNA adenosine deaminase-associated protein [Nocardioides sp. TRM66260-LWL]
MSEQLDAVDFAFVAYLEDDEWVLDDLADHHLRDVADIAEALSRLPGDDGALALIGVDEDFFLVVRVVGERTRVLLSDVTAADEWDLAESALELLGLADADDLGDLADPDHPRPVGDLGLLADLGVEAAELAELLDDPELYPDEALSEIADLLGFGEIFDDAVGLTPA